jgi:hypothetical protein
MAHAQDKPVSRLGSAMQDIGRDYRALTKQLPDAQQNASSIALLGNLVDASKVSRAEAPSRAESLPTEARGPFLTAYQAKMDELIAVFEEMKKALLANDNATALKLKDKIGPIMKEGHQTFR